MGPLNKFFILIHWILIFAKLLNSSEAAEFDIFLNSLERI